MADIELGKTYVEIQARMDRLESDFKRAESSAKKSADKMENSFKSASLRCFMIHLQKNPFRNRSICKKA